MKESRKAEISIMIAAALWGCIGIFFNLLTDCGFTRIQAVALRIWVAAVLYASYLLITDRDKLKIKLKHCWYFIGTGIVSLVFFNICYFNCIALSSMSVAAVLLYTAPIFVALMSAVFFKERITRKKVLALIVTFGGCLLVTGVVGDGTERLPLMTILYGLGSGIGYALYSIFGKFALRDYSSETVTVYTFIFGSIPLFFLVDAVGTLSMVTTPRAVFGAVGGIMCSALPYIFYTKGLQSTEPGRAAIIATLEPVVASILSVAFFGDRLTFGKTLGILMVIGAIVMLNVDFGKKRHKKV